MDDEPEIELPELPDPERQAISLWMQQRFDIIEKEHQARIDLLRTAGEHPSPIFSSMVKRFGGLGLSKTLCAKMLGIGVGTLNQHYEDDYDLGAAEIISGVAANMVRIATSTSDPQNAKVGMAILERRGGNEWRPAAKKIEINDGSNNPPIIDSSKLTYEERQALRAMLTRVANGGEGDPVEPDEEDPVIP
jgi:hypothetical protein